LRSGKFTGGYDSASGEAHRDHNCARVGCARGLDSSFYDNR